jgi:hypothetical protein
MISTRTIQPIYSNEKIRKLADFVVIPVDYMTIPAEDICKFEQEMTVIGGEGVYTRPVQAQK